MPTLEQLIPTPSVSTELDEKRLMMVSDSEAFGALARVMGIRLPEEPITMIVSRPNDIVMRGTGSNRPAYYTPTSQEGMEAWQNIPDDSRRILDVIVPNEHVALSDRNILHGVARSLAERQWYRRQRARQLGSLGVFTLGTVEALATTIAMQGDTFSQPGLIVAGIGVAALVITSMREPKPIKLPDLTNYAAPVRLQHRDAATPTA